MGIILTIFLEKWIILELNSHFGTFDYSSMNSGVKFGACIFFERWKASLSFSWPTFEIGSQ